MPTIALARAKLVVPVRGKPRLTRNDQPSSGAGRGGSGASHVSVDGKARSAGMPPHFDTSLSATGERDSDHAETCEKQDSNLRQSMRACAGKAGHVRSSRPDLARASLGLDMNVVMSVGMPVPYSADGTTTTTTITAPDLFIAACKRNAVGPSQALGGLCKTRINDHASQIVAIRWGSSQPGS